jgi:hypothetical protein
VIRRSFLTLLLRISNSREERISNIKILIRARAKGKAISKKSAKITHPPGKKITEKQKTYFLLNVTIIIR